MPALIVANGWARAEASSASIAPGGNASPGTLQLLVCPAVPPPLLKMYMIWACLPRGHCRDLLQQEEGIFVHVALVCATTSAGLCVFFPYLEWTTCSHGLSLVMPACTEVLAAIPWVGGYQAVSQELSGLAWWACAASVTAQQTGRVVNPGLKQGQPPARKSRLGRG